MIERILEKKLKQLVTKFPVVSVTGPRQSGKTTLLKNALKKYEYTNLEDPETRLFAEKDPRGFLSGHDHLIIDEIQRVPELFSYIQVISDEKNNSGQFILSGSQSFLLSQHISQSLAGRIGILNLLPFSQIELNKAGIDSNAPEKLILKGFYPRLYDKDIDPADFYPGYIQTYVERDVRLLQNVHNLNLFIRFMKLCAGRTGQLLNLSSLASDCGISVNTAKSWISLLETSFVIFLLQPDHVNFNKRLVKMPKLYFHDTGLACSLLEIQDIKQLESHYLKGGLFENFILSEFLKHRFNQGLANNCSFWRDNKGVEIDCVIHLPGKSLGIEIKSGKTFNTDFISNLQYWQKLFGKKMPELFLIYGGNSSRKALNTEILSWKDISSLLDRISKD